MSSANKLPVLGHLRELRSRLLKAVLAVIFTTVLAFVFADWFFQFLTSPIQGYQLIYIDMTEMVGVYMNLCLAVGISLAMPYLVYQAMMFISPALTPKEKKYLYFSLPWIAAMFIGGIIFSYFVLLPPATKFLFNFGSDIATPQIRIGSYVTLVTRVMLASGIIFELPVVSTFLARLGVISPAWLADKRKIFIVLAFVLGAIITPTFDPINQSLVAGPLIALYELSIWLARLVQPRNSRSTLPVSSAVC